MYLPPLSTTAGGGWKMSPLVHWTMIVWCVTLNYNSSGGIQKHYQNIIWNIITIQSLREGGRWQSLCLEDCQETKLLWQPLDSHIRKYHFLLLVEMPGFIGSYMCLKCSLHSGNLLRSDMSDISKSLNTIQPLLVSVCLIKCSHTQVLLQPYDFHICIGKWQRLPQSPLITSNCIDVIYK